MTPNQTLITIDNNENLIQEFLNDLIIKPRTDIRKWSELTKQTPTLKLGYIGQHLSSLITGMEGVRTGARGHDIVDGTEVKSCNKVDQSDKCKDCNQRLMRIEEQCFNCGSYNIKRNNDSKWLFSIRSLEELEQYLDLDRVFLLISDYPNFIDNDFSSVRFEAFEIYPKNSRMVNFKHLIENHYYNIYLPKVNRGDKTNPMNLHPYLIQFYQCNPIKVFSCTINNIDTNPVISINHFIKPSEDRSSIESEKMPIQLLKYDELLNLIQNSDFETIIKPNLIDQNLNKEDVLSRITTRKDTWTNVIPFLNEEAKNRIPLRDINSIVHSSGYTRN